MKTRLARAALTAAAAALLLAACSGATTPAPAPTPAAALSPAPLAPGERLSVVATTTLIGDAVRRIGGDHVDLTVLLPAGSDPHAYVATPQDLVALADAQAVFVNGLGLEEALLPALGRVEQGPVIEVNAGIEPIASDGGAHAEEEAAADHDHGPADPHTWQDVRNVIAWTGAIADALAALDPANAPAYVDAASAYAAELEALDADLKQAAAQIPAARRLLVTDHDNLSYFARAYDFTIVGTVVPSFSTLATLSAQEMAALQDQIRAQGVPAIFVGSTVNPTLADQIAQDTGARVVPLYTDSLSTADGPAPDYVTMMRGNMQAIVAALR